MSLNNRWPNFAPGVHGVHRICPAICGTQLRAVGYSRCSGCTQPHDTALVLGSATRRMAAAVRSIMQFDAVLLGAVGVHLANPNDPHVCGVADGVSPAHRISSRETALPSTPTHRRPTPLPRVYVRACVHRVARVCTPTSAHICTLAPSCPPSPSCCSRLHRTLRSIGSHMRKAGQSCHGTLPARRRRRSLAKGRSTTTYTLCSRGRCCKCCTPARRGHTDRCQQSLPCHAVFATDSCSLLLLAAFVGSFGRLTLL